MQRFMAVLIGGLCIVTAASALRAASATVTGQVVDLNCYNIQTRANAGMDHAMGRECAWACAKWWSQPVGLVTADGKVYQLAGGLVADNNARIATHVTHTVTITGDVSEKDGITVLTANDLTMVKAPAK